MCGNRPIEVRATTVAGQYLETLDPFAYVLRVPVTTARRKYYYDWRLVWDPLGPGSDEAHQLIAIEDCTTAFQSKVLPSKGPCTVRVQNSSPTAPRNNDDEGRLVSTHIAKGLQLMRSVIVTHTWTPTPTPTPQTDATISSFGFSWSCVTPRKLTRWSVPSINHSTCVAAVGNRKRDYETTLFQVRHCLRESRGVPSS